MKKALALIVALLCVVGAASYGLESIDIFTGLLVVGNPPVESESVDGAPTGAPSPILNTLTTSFVFDIGRLFRFAPELTLYGTQYGWLSVAEKAVPVERQYADAVWFLSAVAEPLIWLNIPLGVRHHLGFQFGLAFNMRIPITSWGTGRDQLKLMASYLYSEARFFYPDIGFTFSWRPAIYDKLVLSTRARILLPMFHIWDGEEVEFMDQFIASFSIGLRLFRRSIVESISDETSSSGETQEF